MHIHGNQMNVLQASLYAASQGERTAAAKRAAEVRKKLLKSVAEADGDTGSGETLLIGKWLDEGQDAVLDGDQYRPSASGKDPDFG